MTAYETRAATEDERDRLALLRPTLAHEMADKASGLWAYDIDRITALLTRTWDPDDHCAELEMGRKATRETVSRNLDYYRAWARAEGHDVYRPTDKQGDVEPFDIEADWIERS